MNWTVRGMWRAMDCDAADGDDDDEGWLMIE
jgi:hypothetical protein